MTGTNALHALAQALGIHLEYADGLGRRVAVSDETLLRLCTVMGAPVSRLEDCPAAWAAHQARPTPAVPPVMVAWDGAFRVPVPIPPQVEAVLELEGGGAHLSLRGDPSVEVVVPFGYHRLRLSGEDGQTDHVVIAAPTRTFRRDPQRRDWGVTAQLAALRSQRSRALGDLQDLEWLARWLAEYGARFVMLLPILPTFNTAPVEVSPYSPVSRLFWSELILDLGADHRPVGRVESLEVTRGHREVWEALTPRDTGRDRDPELMRYARFRGVQERWGRNWREWPEPARSGDLGQADCDHGVTAFHHAAQCEARAQLDALQHRLHERGMHLGLDLTVGVHPDGYDAWSRQELFADGVSVGAPPDPGFPSGQDWGFRPVLPHASRQEGHRYLAASLRHQMAVAGVIRVDHVMAFERLYWIPQGMALDEGSYVDYPADELFAVLTLESHRNRCEVVGENLGTVPDSIHRALERHRIHGLFIAQFQAAGEAGLVPPSADDMALIGSHDTPTFAGWVAGDDIDERVRFGLMDASAGDTARQERHDLVSRLAALLGLPSASPPVLLLGLLTWLGASPASMVAPWLEDLWLEQRGVNLPGTPASLRDNWQRPMQKMLEEIPSDPLVGAGLSALRAARLRHDA